MITRAVIWAAVLAGAVLAPSSAHAGIWTPIASGTTEQINAVDYQSPTRFWYATTNGTIGHRKPDGTFGTGAGPAVGVIFNDIAFSVHWASATTVYITGNKSNILKSANAGTSFAEVNKKANDNDGT